MWLKAPTTLGQIVSVSHEGGQYPVVDGMVEVPDTARILLEQGFVQTGPPEAMVSQAKPSGGDGSAGNDKPKPLILNKGKR